MSPSRGYFASGGNWDVVGNWLMLVGCDVHVHVTLENVNS